MILIKVCVDAAYIALGVRPLFSLAVASMCGEVVINGGDVMLKHPVAYGAMSKPGAST